MPITSRNARFIGKHNHTDDQIIDSVTGAVVGLTANQKAGLDAQTSLSAANPVATIADLTQNSPQDLGSVLQQGNSALGLDIKDVYAIRGADDDPPNEARRSLVLDDAGFITLTNALQTNLVQLKDDGEVYLDAGGTATVAITPDGAITMWCGSTNFAIESGETANPKLFFQTGFPGGATLDIVAREIAGEAEYYIAIGSLEVTMKQTGEVIFNGGNTMVTFHPSDGVQILIGNITLNVGPDNVTIENLPTSPPAVANAIYSDGGTLKIT